MERKRTHLFNIWAGNQAICLSFSLSCFIFPHCRGAGAGSKGLLEFIVTLLSPLPSWQQLEGSKENKCSNIPKSQEKAWEALTEDNGTGVELLETKEPLHAHTQIHTTNHVSIHVSIHCIYLCIHPSIHSWRIQEPCSKYSNIFGFA